MLENADGSVIPSVIPPPHNSFYRARDCARIFIFGGQICTITDGETDALVEMIRDQSRMEKRIHLRIWASWTGQQTQKVLIEMTL
jgi:hypothetical protein